MFNTPPPAVIDASDPKHRRRQAGIGSWNVKLGHLFMVEKCGCGYNTQNASIQNGLRS